jgi:hypothetical protein
MSLRDDLMKAGSARPLVSVSCSDLGAGTVWLRVLTGAENDEYMKVLMANDYKSAANSRATLVALCLVDEAGTSIFTLADVPALMQWQRPLLDRLFTAAFNHNKLGVNDQVTLEGN